MSNQSDERRRFSRVHFDGQSRLLFGDESAPVELLDLSLRGALVSVPDMDMPTDSAVTLEVQLAGHEIEILMECTVAHREENHLGLLCTHIDIESISHLRRLVELNLGESILLERELAGLVAPADKDPD